MTGILVVGSVAIVATWLAWRTAGLWKLFSAVAGVCAYYAIATGVSGAATGVGVIVGNIGAVVIALTVCHYVASLPAGRPGAPIHRGADSTTEPSR